MKNDNRILAAYAAVAGFTISFGLFYYSEHITEIQEGSVYAVHTDYLYGIFSDPFFC